MQVTLCSYLHYLAHICGIAFLAVLMRDCANAISQSEWTSVLTASGAQSWLVNDGAYADFSRISHPDLMDII